MPYARRTRKTANRRYARRPARPTRAMRPKTTRRRYARPTVRSGGTSNGIQRFNTRGSKSFVVNRTTVLPTITSSPGGVAVIYSPPSSTCPLYATYTGQFTKYKVNYIRLRFELTTMDQTDDSVMPTIYIRRNIDPDQTTVGVSGTSMMLLPGTIKKTFTPTSNVMEFLIYPYVMTAGLQTPAGTYMPMPRRMGYVDNTQDVTLYGAMYFVAAAALNQTILVTSEWNTIWSNPR